MSAHEPTGVRVGTIRLEPLDRYDAWHLLTEAAAREGIARVVWSGADGPAIVPLNFTVAGGALWFQVAVDSRLAQECPGQRVMVEADHVDAATHTGWSVIVTGTATTMPTAADPGLLEHLEVWPRGGHQELVRVEADEVTGRRLRHRE
jgi:nitroimidazol reductase NimA-like FMN-containing flavoprotein (pyridoxamine 5'-phosphate oxidase superfamily)